MGFFKRLFGGKDEQPEPAEQPVEHSDAPPPGGIATQLAAVRKAAEAQAAKDARRRALQDAELSAPGPLPASKVTYSSSAPPLDARFSLEPEHFVVECPGPGGAAERFRFPFDCLALVAAGNGRLRLDLHVPVPAQIGAGRLALRSFLAEIDDGVAGLRWERLARKHFLVAAKCPYCFQPGLEVDPLRIGVAHPVAEGQPQTRAVCQACRSSFAYDYAAGKFVLLAAGH